MKVYLIPQPGSWIRSLLRVGLGLFLISPFLVILAKSGSWTWPKLSEFFEALVFTSLQAGLSSLGSILVGILGALGLLRVGTSHWRKGVEILFMIPCFLPPLMVILPLMSGASFLHVEVFGLLGIVLVHVIMNLGLVSVLIVRLLEFKVGPMVELSWVEGASRWMIIKRGLLPILYPDLLAIGFYLFVVSFASFSVPLILGGPGAITLEVLIYEKIRVYGDWSQAITLGFGQILLLFLFSIGMRPSWMRAPVRPVNLQILGLRFFVVVPLLVTFLIGVGQFQGLIKGMSLLFQSPVLMAELPGMILGSLFVGLGTGGLLFLLMVLVAGLSPHRGLQRFLFGYTAPSTVLVGFAFLLLGIQGWLQIHLAIILGLTILMLPALYRMLAQAKVESLQQQVVVARVASASWWLIFRRLIFPQVRREFWWLAGMGSFWACGDFALSSLVAERNSTLALAVKAYMTSYHLERATALNFVLLVIGGLCFLGMGGLGRVDHSPSSS